MNNRFHLFLAVVAALVGTAQAVFAYSLLKHDASIGLASGFAVISGAVAYVATYACVRRGCVKRLRVRAP
jgi:hypothetical protein